MKTFCYISSLASPYLLIAMVIFAIYLALFLVPLVLVFFVYKQRKSSSHASNSNLPPGKSGWPIIGETWDFAMAMKEGTPEKFINDRVSEHSSEVFKTCLFREDMVVFGGAAGNKFLFSNENKYVTSWWPSSVEKVLYPPEFQGTLQARSKAIRSFLIELFKPESLQRYIPIMDSTAKQHLETKWCPNYNKVTVFPLVKDYTFSLATNLFMNINEPEQVNMLLRLFTSMIAGLISLPINLPGTKFRRGIQAGTLIRRELVGIIKQRKKELEQNVGLVSTGTDVLTQLLLLEMDDSSDDTTNEIHICVNLIGLLVASYETVSTAITFTIYHLARHPHVYKRVMEEQMEVAKSKRVGELLNWEDVQKMKYSWCVACESMRLFPPSFGTFREAITDFTYANFTIPKGWKAHWTTNSTHKNSKYFSNPERFDPSRFEGSGPAPYTFVPFGGGPRMCVGKEYARLEILVFIHNVVTKFKFKKLSIDEKIVCNPNPIPENGLQVQLELVN